MKDSEVEYQKLSPDSIEVELDVDERGFVRGSRHSSSGNISRGKQDKASRQRDSSSGFAWDEEQGSKRREEDEEEEGEEEGGGRRRGGESGEDEDLTINNFEQHFIECYKFFQMKGFQSFFLTRLFGIATVLWIMFVALVLIEFVNYSAFHDDQDDDDVVIDISTPTNPFFYVVLFAGVVYSIVLFVKFLWAVPRYWRIRRLFVSVYNIEEDELETVQWDTVARRISQSIQSRRNKQLTEIDQLRMAQLIMRKENIFIGLVWMDVFGDRTKRLFSRYFVSLFNDLVTHQFLQKIDEMSSERKRIEIIQSIRIRLVLLSFGLLLISPFVFIYQIMTIGVSFVEELRSKSKSISTRQWSTFGYWEIRHFNELEHFVGERLTKATPYGNTYIDMFFSSVLTAICRFLVLVCATIVVLSLGLEFIFDDFMTSQLFGRSFFWYAGVAAAILVVARSLIPPDNIIVDTKKAFDQIYLFTQYKPRSWEGREHTPHVLNKFERLFDYRILVTLREVFSAFIAPILLLSVVNMNLDAIFGHISSNIDYVESIGWISSFSNFGVGRPQYFRTVTKKSGESGICSKRGKLESSLCNFIGNHPSWDFEAVERLSRRRATIDDMRILEHYRDLFPRHEDTLNELDALLEARTIIGSTSHSFLIPNITTRRNVGEIGPIALHSEMLTRF